MFTISKALSSTFNSVGREQDYHLRTHASITETLEKFAIVSAAYNSFERYSEHVPLCAEGTRYATLKAITQWTRSNDPRRMCWLSGKAGTGKSEIAHTIAEQCDQEQRLGFSFFFSRRHRDRSDMTKFIPTLAYQLSVFLPGVRDSMERAVARNPAIFHQSPKDQLTQLVIHPLLSIVDSLSTMTIVIDGLDEYSGEVPLAELVGLFHDMSNRLPFRIFITSRPEARSYKIFNSPSMIRQTYRLNLRDFSSRAEVHALLRSRLSTVRDKRGLPSTWPSTSDLNRLSEQSDGLYLYVEMLIRFIDDRYGNPVKRLQSALNAHSGIDHLYYQILLEARRYPSFQRVIGSIVCLADPLRISALAELLRLPSRSIRLALRGCFSILIIPDDDRDYIRPYHASLRDFSTNRDRAKDHFLDPLRYNLSIMDDCVKLLHGNLANGAEGRESVRYACRYWCHHLRMAISCTSGVDHVRWDIKARMIELMKNLQSRWLQNWMLMLENLSNVKEVHKDLNFAVTKFESQPSDGESSTVFPELQELFEEVDKFLEISQWIIDGRADEYSDSKQSSQTCKALRHEASRHSTLQGGPSRPAQRLPTILSDLDEKEELCANMLLPAELITIVLEHLDFTTIHRCRQVSRAIRHLIDTSMVIRYKIELAVAGMEDGPPSNVGPVDRLKILEEHQSAWHKLTWKNDHVITMFRYEWEPLWGCLGGVLASVLPVDGSHLALVVRQLPSVVRGIKETKWRIDMNFRVERFTFDPSQDLLAVIEMVDVSTVRIHTCTLSTGEQHPLSVGPLNYTRPNTSQNRLHICGSLLGIIHPSFYLKIWNWKRDDMKMELRGPIESFSFLSEQYVMLAFISSGTGESTMSLDIFDLGRAHEYTDDACSANALCSFRFPPIGPHYTKMLIRSDATSGRTSHSYGSVPFSTSQSDRLCVVSCMSDSRADPTLVLFVHLSTLLAMIATLPRRTKGRCFAWAQWGEEGARLLHLPSSTWITHVHGTKFALIRNQQLEVYDFNKLSVKRNRVRMRHNMESNDPYLLCNESIGPVCSRLPYDMHAVPISSRASVDPMSIRSVLLTEDSLILIPIAPDGDCVVLTF